MKRIISVCIICLFMVAFFSSCKKECICTMFSPDVPDRTEEYKIKKNEKCSDFEVFDEVMNSGIRCQ